MDRKLHILNVALAVIAGLAVCMVFLNTPEKSYSSDQSVVHLYFADRENRFLIAEDRAVLHSDEPADLGRIIIKELMGGPREGLMQTIPAGTKLRAFYITQDGIAYVDLTGEIAEEHPGGVKSELLTIYSMVNSLILNISEINAVKILIGGGESLTLTGHIDLRLPFKADMLLIR
ncbi:MAG: GerMN domain-containing protein [Desulfobacterales bacterium]|uniref:GerMN domain-containing protein n=1 Tax=Candidatus Desulfaltia bathyphila TaxID=2841697 RepID=A0A8J6N6X1_9BACT|nr:GerMN domain-containing protein [Candidatus Desulfaltia bathyphila]MBL7196180.1 GerMN domain-containing protein [Desulfobacterales bacterium]MBL7208078.1 GerMN domain-containing protein [Desulfobacterales bacterium]